MKNILAMIIVSSMSLVSLSVQANGLDNIAACAGTIVGNGAIDFINDNEQAFDDAGQIAYSGYLGHVLSGKYAKDERKLADMIMGANMNKIITAANTNTFTIKEYEEVIGCYRMIGLEVLRNSESIKSNGDLIQELISNSMNMLKRVLRAG